MPTYSFKACAIFKVVGVVKAESLEEARAAIDNLSNELRFEVAYPPDFVCGVFFEGGDGQSLKLDGAPRLITSELWVEEGDHELA